MQLAPLAPCPVKTHTLTTPPPARNALRRATLALLTLAAIAAATPAADPSTPTQLAIPVIQGRDARSVHAGRRVATTGVVTLVTRNGFWLQDATGDGDPSTSDGLFIHTGSGAFDRPDSPADLSAGDRVRVAGRVVEFETGVVDAREPTVTQLGHIESIRRLGRGAAIDPTRVVLDDADAIELERHEGMLVTLHAPDLTVTHTFHLGRYGQLLLGTHGRLTAPTDRHRPGSAAARALATRQARQRLVLDDASSVQHPDPTPHRDPLLGLPRSGDRVGPVTGIVDFGVSGHANPGPGDWRIHPTLAPSLARKAVSGSRPPAVGGGLRIAAFSLQNFFATFADGSNADGRAGVGCRRGDTHSASHCRGAGEQAEFERQLTKLVAALVSLDADAIGLTEVENDTGRALQLLMAALNGQVGAATYAAVATPREGTGSDAIRVALLYRTRALRPLGAPVSDTDPVNLRPTLAQAFEHRGQRLLLMVAHFKSKAGCPSASAPDARGNLDTGDGQGCWNGLRVAQARRLAEFSAARQAAAGTDLALVLGDLNAYAREDPIDQLTHAGHVDLVARHDPGAHTHVFGGMAGRLDHALATGALAARVTGAAAWHINADEPPLLDYNLEFRAPRAGCGGATCPADAYQPDARRSSDHDPILIGVDLHRPPGGTDAGGPSGAVRP